MSGRFSESEFDVLVYWIRERERIRLAKESGQPKPWTADPLLRAYRFCNVRRLDDRVSRWLFERWYGDPDGDPAAAAALARLVNWPDSLREISYGHRFVSDDLDVAREMLHARAGRGAKVFTGAYVIPGVRGENKVDSVCDLVETVASMARRETMRGMWWALMEHDGLGGFLAGQMVADMAHLSIGRGWPDRDTWAPVGPGSARGINRLLGRPKNKPVSQEAFEKLLPELAEVVRPRIADIWADRRLQAMDLQNCLCEFDKYRRLTLGEGKVRARYDGGAPAARGGLFG